MKRQLDITSTEREVQGRTYLIELAKDTNPNGNRFEFEGKNYAWIIKAPKPVEAQTYIYEAFSKQIDHPKLATPILKDDERLEFTEELTSQEIGTLEQQLGKKIRKIE